MPNKSLYNLVRWVNSDLYRNLCVHNGEENPFCGDIQDADGWWCSMEDIKQKRNEKYKMTLSGIDFIKFMIAWNKEIDIPRVQDAFDVSYATVQRTIKYYGLQGMGYKSHYNKVFGEGAWDQGNNTGRKRSHAAATAQADDNGNEE